MRRSQCNATGTGKPFWVLLGPSGSFWVAQYQKNTRRTQKEKNISPPCQRRRLPRKTIKEL